MDQPCLDALYLTEDEFQIAHEQIREAAYHKWIDAGCPSDRELEFWLEAELEWVEYRYVPDRYASSDELHKCE